MMQEFVYFISNATSIHNGYAYAENVRFDAIQPMNYPSYEELMLDYAVTSAQVALMDNDLNTIIEDLGLDENPDNFF